MSKSYKLEPRARASERQKFLLDQLARLPTGPARPKLTEPQITRIVEAFSIHPVEVFNAVMDRADRYGDDPDAQLAAALDYEALRWKQSTTGMRRTQAWQVVTDLLTLGGGVR